MIHIACRNVHKNFVFKRVLRGVDLIVNPGETLVIIGRSGCGKSVLLKHLVGLITPDRGHVYVDGEDITHFRRKKLFEMRMRFGMVFQGSALFDSLTVGENVTLALREHTDKTDAEIKEICEAKLAQVGLRGVVDKYPAELSGGMKKRVGFARAIAMEPECILYDEPTTGLDPIMADVINNLIVKLGDELETTSVVVTHDMASAYKVGDRIAMLHGGRIVFSGTPDEVRGTDNQVVRRFVDAGTDQPAEAGSG